MSKGKKIDQKEEQLNDFVEDMQNNKKQVNEEDDYFYVDTGDHRYMFRQISNERVSITKYEDVGSNIVRFSDRLIIDEEMGAKALNAVRTS